MRACVVCADPSARRLFAGIPGLTAVDAHEPPDPTADAWVAWGGVRLPAAPPGVRVLNRPEAVARLADRPEVRERLRLAGLVPASLAAVRSQVGVRPVRVSLLDLCPWAVEVPDGRTGAWRPAAPDELGGRVRDRAVGAAIRALHALGLDLGRVVVAVGPPQRPEAVCRIELGPRPGPTAGALRERLAEWLGDPVRVRPEVALARPPVLLGADPEFVLVDPLTREVLPASRFLPRAGSAGCDGQATAPGVYPLAELRPAPAPEPRALVAAIRRCMLRAAARVPPDLAWLAGSEPVPGLPTGGHIHFSGVRLSGALLRALDAYLALPVLMLEPPAAAARRRQRHGFLGDVRFKRDGRFEYRTLPSWLVSPRVAAGVLALARLVACEHPLLPADPLADLASVRAFYAGRREALRPWIARLRRHLERLPGYARYEADVAPLLARAEAGEPWDEAADLRAAWGLPVGVRAASAAGLRAAGAGGLAGTAPSR